MNMILRIPALLLLVISSALCDGKRSDSVTARASTEHAIDSLIVAQHGVFAVAFKDLQSGETILRREKEPFHAASTMKTPVMIEVFKQAAAGRIGIDDSVDVVNLFHSIVDGSEFRMDLGDDSDDGMYKLVGKKASVRQLVTAMITVSSNLATNILIEKVGAKNVTSTMRSMGAADIQVLRGVEDGKAFAKGLNNTTTANDLMVIFEKIALGRAVSAAASREMTDVLEHQRFNEMIPALLPKEVVVAHKTGSITGIQHDSGIITLPDGRRYILVVLSKELQNADQGIHAIAAISKLLYDYQTGK